MDVDLEVTQESKDAPPVRVLAMEVKGLLGEFNHSIELHPIERVTVLHGPNGYGKTTLLRILAAVGARDWTELAGLPFDSVGLRLSDGSTLQVAKLNRGDEQYEKVDKILREAVTGLRHDSGRLTLPLTVLRVLVKRGRKFILDELAVAMPGLHAGPGGGFRFSSSEGSRHVVSGEYLRQALIEELSPGSRPGRRGVGLRAANAWEVDLPSLSVTLIETQRLTVEKDGRRDKGDGEPAVVRHAADLRATLAAESALYGQRSQDLDRTFARRALGPMRSVPVQEEIRRGFQALQRKRERLYLSALLDPMGDREMRLPRRDLEEWERHFLNRYIEDTEAKLSSFDDTLRRIEVFLSIVNSDFTRKRLIVDRESGLRVLDSRESEIPLTSLSSGEQHLVVLLYRLLFQTPSNSLVLIDEPELSLHVAWQRDLLQQLGEISEVSNVDFVLATHSPSVIAGRWELCYSLAGSEGEEE